MEIEDKQILKVVILSMLIGIGFLYGISLVSALDDLQSAKLDQEYIIKQTCASCFYINISVSNVNGFVLNNVAMTNNGSGVWIYNYTPTETGRHDVNGIGDLGGVDTNFATYFEVTTTGNEEPDGIITIFFIIGFLIIIFFLGSLFISNLGHFAEGDYGLQDLIYNTSLYFVLLAFYFLHSYYLSLPLIENILVWLIGITGFTNVGFSFFAFIFCYLKKIMENKERIREYGE